MLLNMLNAKDLNNKVHVDFAQIAVSKLGLIARTDDSELCELLILILCSSSELTGCRDTIVEMELLGFIRSETIHANMRLGNAYLTMYQNIANNSEMRDRIIDENLLKRFTAMAEQKNPEVNLAVMAALYCVTCR